MPLLQWKSGNIGVHITPIFPDFHFLYFVGFTAMSARLDPEDVREILNAYFNRWTACIEAQHGLVEKFIGDAVMTVFGLPAAQEDDPERAIHASLNMRAQLEQLNQELLQSFGLHLSMRAGIHTGPVVVSYLGDRKGQDRAAEAGAGSRRPGFFPETGLRPVGFFAVRRWRLRAAGRHGKSFLGLPERLPGPAGSRRSARPGCARPGAPPAHGARLPPAGGCGAGELPGSYSRPPRAASAG